MIVVAGEALMDLIVAPDGRVDAVAGGGPFNTARTIARLGGDVAFLGRLSNDRFGMGLRGALEADGVDLRWAPTTGDPTTLAIAEIDEDGTATYRFHLAGTSAPGLTADEVGAAFGARPAAIHVGTLGLTVEPIASVLATGVEAASAETLVMLDVNARPSVVRDRPAYLARLEVVFARADIVKVSADDLAYVLPGAAPPDAAASIHGRAGAVVLLTDGAQAVGIVGDGWTRTVPVPEVPVVDTVGAGDAFGGGFLARWIERGLGRDGLADPALVVDATLVGIDVAGLTCGRPGADPPRRAEVARLSG